jgi:hypothetical protein
MLSSLPRLRDRAHGCSREQPSETLSTEILRCKASSKIFGECVGAIARCCLSFSSRVYVLDRSDDFDNIIDDAMVVTFSVIYLYAYLTPLFVPY